MLNPTQLPTTQEPLGANKDPTEMAMWMKNNLEREKFDLEMSRIEKQDGKLVNSFLRNRIQ